MQGNTCVQQGDVPTIECISVVLQQVVNFAVAFAGGVAVVFIMYAAYQLATSRGDREKIETAKHTLTYAIIGLLVIIFSFVIIKLIGTLIGVPASRFGIF